jgi:hypothetical protein
MLKIFSDRTKRMKEKNVVKNKGVKYNMGVENPSQSKI